MERRSQLTAELRVQSVTQCSLTDQERQSRWTPACPRSCVVEAMSWKAPLRSWALLQTAFPRARNGAQVARDRGSIEIAALFAGRYAKARPTAYGVAV